LTQANKLRRQLSIVTILLLAFALRMIAINKIPAGLSHDEAYNGVTAIQLLEGQHRIFFEINKGIEPLIIYLEAIAFYAFGVGVTSLRLVNVFSGMLTVALAYPFTVRLLNRRIALLAVAGIAISFWAVFVSRLALRAVLLPPLLLLTIYFFWRGLSAIRDSHTSSRESSPFISKFFLLKPMLHAYQALFLNFLPQFGYFAISGAAAGITMYTYLSSRFFPLIIVAIFGYLLIHRKIQIPHWQGLLLHFFIWGALFAPLAIYFWQNPESFTHRADQVITIPYALDGDFGPITRNTFRTLGMFTFRGDTTDRYNLDGRPVFDWLNGLFFYMGVGLAAWHTYRSPGVAEPFALLITAFFMLLPGFITDDSPHFLRTIGALPIIYIFWALGVDMAMHKINSWRMKTTETLLTNLRRPLAAHRSFLLSPTSLIVLILVLTTFHTSYDYFKRWATAPGARHIYGADIAEIADYLKISQNQDLPAISAEYYRDLDKFRFQIHFQGHPPFVIWFDGRQTLAFPPPGSNLSVRYIFPASAPAAPTWRELIQLSPAESGQEYNLYRLSNLNSLEQYNNRLTPIGINVNNDLVLLGYQLLGEAIPGEKFQILLNWQALRALPPGTDYTFLAQLRDQQGQPQFEVDGNGYDPADWQPGVVAYQLLALRLPPDLAPGKFNLSLQVVDRHDGQPLSTGNNETRIELNPIEIEFAP
jgi:4-amino-4-deoxy-L-arabinose transferase-like glycosyltransferase